MQGSYEKCRIYAADKRKYIRLYGLCIYGNCNQHGKQLCRKKPDRRAGWNCQPNYERVSGQHDAGGTRAL